MRGGAIEHITFGQLQSTPKIPCSGFILKSFKKVLKQDKAAPTIIF